MDDTTTWLKKNTSINPIRKSLRASLRYHAPCSDMNTSIMSNPDKVKDQGLFIPRMLQKSHIQMRKSTVHNFRVPELPTTKPVVKSECSEPRLKQEKIPRPNRVKKSLLPVPKSKGQVNEKAITKSSLPKPSFAPTSCKSRTAKRELIKKMVELSEIKRKEEAESQSKAVSGDSSVLRSILKIRASLRRSSQVSAKKPKAKKVLFDGFENSDGDKENVSLSFVSQNDSSEVSDKPSGFLNFPVEANNLDSPFEFVQKSNCAVEKTNSVQSDDVNHLIKLWVSYKENLESIYTERSSLEDSFESFLQQSLNFQKQYQAFKETSEGMYRKLYKLGKEIEENLEKMVAEGNFETSESKKRLLSRKGFDKAGKIKMSDKSKMIKKNSGKKSVPLLTKEFLGDMKDSFSLIPKK